MNLESLGIDKLCDLGDSAYYLFPDTSIRWKYHSHQTIRMVYSETPLNRGYSEFMPHQLARAMEENGLFKDNPEIYQEAKRYFGQEGAMIKFNPEKFTAMVENEFSMATHVFKSPKDAEAFARDMLDELANRLVTITITVCGKKVVQSGITFDKANRLKEKFVDAVISEACHFRNDSLKRNYREGIQEYFCRLCPEKSCPETEMFSCECGWAGPETDLCRKYPKNWPEKQFVTEEYACPKCGSFGVEEIDEYRPTYEMLGKLRTGNEVLIFSHYKTIVKITSFGWARLNSWERPFLSFKSGNINFNQDDILSIRQSAKCWNRSEKQTAFDPEPGERVRLKGMDPSVLITGKKTSCNPAEVKYVGHRWTYGGARESYSFGPDDIVEIV